ncbi:MAG: type IX secretion system membrane protein PorP/SprF [Cyclobacteriaceae bacterium]
MKKIRFYLACVNILFVFSLAAPLHAQDYHNFVQFYINPALINPSLTGSDGQPALFFSYKKQWAGIEGAPSVANVSIQSPLQNKVNLGFHINNEERGIINTSSLLFTGGYTIPINKESTVRFGFSLGATWNQVDINALNFGTPGDPIQVDLLDNNFQLLGNAGVSFHSKGFHVGASIPNMLQPVYLTKDPFKVTEIAPFESIIFHSSYRIYFGNDKNAFEPYIMYRYNQTLPSQLEAAGVLHLQDKIWMGGSYKQDFGISGLGGFNINKQLGVGYSYTLKNTGQNELNHPSHEIHLALLFGERKKNIPVYSFINTEKVKPPMSKKAMEEKKKREELALKKEAELAKKKADEEAKLEEEKKAKAAAQKAEEEMQREQERIEREAQQQQQQQQMEQVQQPVDPVSPVIDNKPVIPERHEIVKRADHRSELEEGNYVIVGVFGSESNAKALSDQIRKNGFSQANYGYLTNKGYWYVHVFQSNDINATRSERDEYRKIPRFKDAWLLTIER